MAKNEINTVLKLEGQDRYNAALKSSYQQLRVLNSELKKEESALKSNATAQDKARLKAQALKKKIEEQKKIVKTLSDALEQSIKQFGKQSSETYKWQIKLNNATTVLNNMNRELDSVTSSVDEFNGKLTKTGSDGVKAMVSINDTIESLKQVFTDIGSLVQGVFTGIANNIKTTVNEASDLIAGAMADAAQWTGISEMYGGNTASIEEYFRTAAYAGYSGSDVTTLINKLVQNTHGGNKNTAAALQKLGISEGKYNNHWDYYTAVWEALQAQDENTRMTLAGDLFGDRYGSKINGMMNNWARGKSEYDKNMVQTGVALSAEEIEAMNNANNQINEILQTWEGIKTKLGTKLWISLDMDEKAQQALEILDDVAKLMFSDGDKAEITAKLTIDLQTFLSTLFTGVGDLSSYLQQVADALKTSDDETVQNMGSIVQSIANLLSWISQNSGLITQALNAWVNFKIADIQTQLYTGMHINQLIEKVGKIAVSVATIAAIRGAGKASSLLSSGSDVTQAAAAGGFFTSMFANAAKVAPWLAGIVALATPAKSQDSDLKDAEQHGMIMNSDGQLVGLNTQKVFTSEPVQAPEVTTPQYTERQLALVDRFVNGMNASPDFVFTDLADYLMEQIETSFGLDSDSAIDAFWTSFWEKSDPEGDSRYTNPLSEGQTIEIVTTLDGAEVARNQYQYLRTALIEDLQTR